MEKPFEVEHIREFGDGTCLLRAVKIKPGFTTGDLIDYVLTRKGDNGASIQQTRTRSKSRSTGTGN